jgi:hypothetical protein
VIARTDQQAREFAATAIRDGRREADYLRTQASEIDAGLDAIERALFGVAEGAASP